MTESANALFVMSILLTLFSQPMLAAQETELSENASTQLRQIAEKDSRATEAKIRNNNQKPAAEFPPKELKSQITQLEVELAVQKLQFGTDHPNIKITEEKLLTLRKMESNIEKENSRQQVIVFKLRNATSSQLVEKIRLVLPRDAGSIVSDDRTNSVIIRGDEKLINETHRLIELLDEEVPIKNEDEKIEPPRSAEDVKSLVPQQEIKVFSLQYIAAIEAQRILADLFGRDLAAISADQRVNSLVVRGQAERLAEIEVILKRLDEKPAEIVAQPALDKVQTNGISDPQSNSSGRNANDFGSSIEAFRRRLNELEKPVFELAEKLRSSEAAFGKGHLNSAKLRADLRALVQQSFVARQEIQRAELVEFSRRLQLMQQTIEARDRISEKIVDRRMEELLDPNVEWTQSMRKAP
jgi:type II secretory pathway component GspD/PulD (secretin)